MNRNALILFVRNPVLGKVKTRLTAAIGEKDALRIYEVLLSHTHDISKSIDADKFVFYSDFIEAEDLWSVDFFYKHLQQGNSLGERMQQAFENIFALGYSRVCIIGSDCYEMTTAIIENAFTAMEKNDAVIGPAKDGGYYLLGLTKMIPGIFENKNWSTATVCTDTIADFEKADIRYFYLPVLNDVDTVEDVPKDLLNQQHTCE